LLSTGSAKYLWSIPLSIDPKMIRDSSPATAGSE
jgi:hypothetical protein